MLRWRRPGREGKGRTAAEDGGGCGAGASGRAPWTGLAAPSGKPARAVKAAGTTKNCSIPLPKPGRRVHNARPAKERSAQAGRTWRRRTKKALHKVLTFSETALTCARSEEHTSELQSLMSISYAGFCLTKKN